MESIIIDNYSSMVKLDLVINGMKSKYPFILNEQAKYTQHEIELYQQNFCNEDSNQMNKYGGGLINIAIVDT
jgi:hypothetical protein